MLGQVDKPDLGETRRGIPVREVPGRGNPPGQWGQGGGAPAVVQEGPLKGTESLVPGLCWW